MMYPKPRLVLSECLEGKPVRYDGNIVSDDFVNKLKKFVEVIPVCPEVSIGLGIPREPVIVVKVDSEIRMLTQSLTKDYTEEMKNFSENFLKSLRDIDGFLLKAKSPSCGVKSTKLYQLRRDNKVVIGRTSGLFAGKALELFPELPLEDEGRLKDAKIRENFLTKLFAFAELRKTLKRTDSIQVLLDFHQRYKYLLLLYHQGNLRKLGRLLANWKELGLEKTKETYSLLFRSSFKRNPSLKAHLNVLQHIYGHFSKKLSSKEKSYISELFNRVLKNKVSLDTAKEYLRSFAFRFESEYLLTQKYFQPYPEELKVL